MSKAVADDILKRLGSRRRTDMASAEFLNKKLQKFMEGLACTPPDPTTKNLAQHLMRTIVRTHRDNSFVKKVARFAVAKVEAFHRNQIYGIIPPLTVWATKHGAEPGAVEETGIFVAGLVEGVATTLFEELADDPGPVVTAKDMEFAIKSDLDSLVLL